MPQNEPKTSRYHANQQTKKMLIGNRRKCKENRNTGISGQRNTDRKKLKASKKQKMMTIRKGLQKKIKKSAFFCMAVWRVFTQFLLFGK